jgi:starch-binding outer membrane protein, SusD/RagB family
MKNIKFILIFLTFVGFSCSDKLDLQPVGSLAAGNFYKTEADAIASVSACYNTLLRIGGQGNGTDTGWQPIGDLWSSDVEPHADIVDYAQIQQYILIPNNQTVRTQWRIGYAGIYLANLALQKIPDIQMDETLKTRLLAEAKFVRAWWYFRLVNQFGNIPLVLEPLATDQLYVAQSTKQNIYNQIEKDLLEAAAVLPVKYTGANIGRVTKGAAEIYLAELYMWQKKWAEAKTKLDGIHTMGYGLVDNYLDLFIGKADNSKEGIWEIQYTANTGLNIGNRNTVLFAPNAEGYVPNGGWGWTRPTPDIVAEFEVSPKEDPRLSFSIFRKGDVFEGKVFVDKVNGTGLGHRKFTISAAMGSETSGQFQTGANLILYRYADALLMTAEVLNELGNQDLAVDYINMVRARPSVDMPPLTKGKSKAEVFEAIRHERRVELCFESKTGFDLRRWGIAESFLKSPNRWQNNTTINPQYGGNFFKFTSPKDELLPIPQLEIDMAQGTLVQNPGHSAK